MDLLNTLKFAFLLMTQKNEVMKEIEKESPVR